VPLNSIGVIFHKLLNEIKQKRKELLMGIDLEEIVKVPDTILDEPNNSTPGFYFGDVQ
jgi:hypothetical protein